MREPGVSNGVAEAIRRVKREHVDAALRSVDREGVPGRRAKNSYCLIEGNKHYPPKWVLKLASERAGIPLGKSRGREFFGGEQTNKPLRKLGFTIEKCPDARTHVYATMPMAVGSGTTDARASHSGRAPSGKGRASRSPSSGSRIPPAEDGYLRATKATLKIILRKHATLGRSFSEWLRNRGCTDIVFEKSRVDIEFREAGQLGRAELKVCGRVGTTKALREALGQLLEYNYYGIRTNAERWYIVLDTQPSVQDKDYIRKLRSALRLPPLVLCWQQGRRFAYYLPAADR